jgi:hypothetical protein
MSEVKVIIRKRLVYTAQCFGGKPTRETTKALSDAGMLYDSRSQQWYTKAEDEQVLSEAEAVRFITGQPTGK